MGKANSTICDWEKGRTTPTPEEVERLCKILDVSPIKLLGGRPSGLSSQEEILLARFRALPEESKQLLLGLTEKMMGTE